MAPVRSGLNFYTSTKQLCSQQQELNFHGFVRKLDCAFLSAIEQACIKKCHNVSMNTFDVSLYPPSRLSN